MKGTGLLPPPRPSGIGDCPPGGTGTAASNCCCFFIIPGVTDDALRPARGETASFLGEAICCLIGPGDTAGGVFLARGC